MCKISQRLQLCTCNQENIEDLENYWVLYRYQKSDMMIVGECLLPDNELIDPNNEIYNRTTLETMLNDGNCFDKALEINNRDSLDIFIKFSNTESETANLIYSYV